jgi:hypothetical protein
MAAQDYISRMDLFLELYEREYNEKYDGKYNDKEGMYPFNDTSFHYTFKKRFDKRITSFYKIPNDVKRIAKEHRIPRKHINEFIRALIESDSGDSSKISIENDVECRQMDEALKSYVRYNYDESQINRVYEQMEFPTQKAENCKAREKDIAKYQAIIKNLRKLNNHDRLWVQFISASPVIKSAEKLQLDLAQAGGRWDAGITQIWKTLKAIELYELIAKYANAHFTKSESKVVINDEVTLYIEETGRYIEKASLEFNWEKAKVFTLYLEEEKQLLSVLKTIPGHPFAELAKTLYEQAQLLIISYYTDNMIADNTPLGCSVIINANIRLLRKLLEFMS